MEQSPEPSGDSFASSTSIKFPLPGKYSIVIQCKMIDYQNNEWIERKNTVIQVLVKESQVNSN